MILERIPNTLNETLSYRPQATKSLLMGEFGALISAVLTLQTAGGLDSVVRGAAMSIRAGAA